MKNNDNSIGWTILLSVLWLMNSNLMAQEKKSFTLDDLMPGGSTYHAHRPQNMNLTFWGHECVVRDVEKVERINQDAPHKDGDCHEDTPYNEIEKLPLFTLKEINGILKEAEIKPIHTLQAVSFPYASKPLVLLSTPDQRILVDFKQKEVVFTQPVVKNAAHLEWVPLTRYLSYTLNQNLFVTTPEGKQLQVTDEPQGVVCGQSVHRDEFGIEKGTFWSPKGNLLAFYRMDERMVADYPQLNVETPIATVENIKYPMAGATSHQVTVGIYNPATQQTVWLQTGDVTDRYFTNISWSPDERKLYLIELNRDQNHSQLVRYNAQTGAREAVLMEERHPKYVEPEHPITFLPWNDQQFIYQSQRDGFNHLYLYNVEGKLIRQLTSGNWMVKRLVGFNPPEEAVIYESTRTSPLETTVQMQSVQDTTCWEWGLKDGVHAVELSSDGCCLIDRYSKPNVPLRIDLVRCTSEKTFHLLEAPDPWKDYNVPTIETGTLKAADGTTDLYYRLVKPVDFDPAKRYPAILYVYGGPHSQMIQNSWNYAVRGWDIYMAQKGYVMLTLDNRGSSNRGLAFENCTFRHLGVEEMEDQLKGVELLKSLNYVDSTRLGVHGWSYGGFMTINLMTTYPDVFKVGVAGGPVIDWKYYEVMYGERYMDTPQDNPQGYEESDLKRKAKNLKGRLQVIIGGNDPTCVPQHTLSFMRACIDAGTQPDLFIYPAQGHNMVGKDRVHLHERITRYFEDYLK